ncbi:MAG TPA: tyrosine-type recombinase/integrase, partial [Anaerolineaceae bacterium]
MTDIIPASETTLTLAQARPLDQNPAAVYLAGLSAGSRATMRQALNTIAGMLTPGVDCLALDWSEVRFQHTAAIRAKFTEIMAAATVNKYLCALRGTLKAAWRLGLVSAEDYQRAAAVESVTGETIPAGHGLTPGELGALLADCQNDPSPAGVRDGAIIALMYAAGLRRQEVTRLELVNYDQITGRLVVLGKRNKERTGYLTNGAAAALGDWLAIRGSEPGALFWRLTQKGELVPGQLTTQA